MGRPRKTVEDLKRSGSYRPSRHGPTPSDPAAATAEPLPCPADLTGPAAGHWSRLAAALVGRVVAADVPSLVLACGWLAETDRCRAALAELDPTDVAHGRALRSATSAAAAADRILRNFALTPAMRAKLPPPPPANGIQRTAVRPPSKLDRMGPPRGP